MIIIIVVITMPRSQSQFPVHKNIYTIMVMKHANSYFTVNLMPIITGQSSEERCTLYIST